MSRGTHTKAAEWIRGLDETKGSTIDSGCKMVLQRLWDYVDWSIERDVAGHECWPSAETIAMDIGSTVSAVRDRLRKLTKAGWVRREGRGIALAWMTPFATAVATCDSGDCDRSHFTMRLWLPDTATAVTCTCDSGRTDHLRIISKPSQDQRETRASQADPEPKSELDLEHEPSETTSLHPNQAAHERIVAEQRDRAAERMADAEANRRRFEAEREHRSAAKPASQDSGPRKPVPDEVWDVVAKHEASWLEAQPGMFSTWGKALGECVRQYNLGPEHVERVLGLWLARKLELGAGLTAAIRDGDFPPMGKLWFSKGPSNAKIRAWLEATIEQAQLAPGEKPRARKFDPKGLTAAGLAGSVDKWDARFAESPSPTVPDGVDDNDDDLDSWGPPQIGQGRR